jgi:hypothetical protein
MESPEIKWLMQALELNEDSHNLLFFERAMEYAEFYSGSNKAFCRELTQGKAANLFWEWYSRQWQQLAADMMHQPFTNRASLAVKKWAFNTLTEAVKQKAYIPQRILERVIGHQKLNHYARNITTTGR